LFKHPLIPLFACTFGIAFSAQAQSCQPYWTNIPIRALPGYPNGIWLAAGIGEEGAGVYALCTTSSTIPNQIFFWNGEVWSEIPRTGMQSNNRIFDMKFFDDGTGSRLYLDTSVGQFPDVVTKVPFRRVNGVWQQMPSFFWSGYGNWPSPMVPANFGDGVHIYGIVNGLYSSVCKWTGATWDVLGGLRSTRIPDNLLVYDSGSGPALYAFGGNFTLNGQNSSFARFNGLTWDLPSPDVGAGGYPGQAAVFDWGQGPRLIAAGAHYSISTTNQATMSMFDGTSWTELGSTHSSEGTLTIAGPIAVYDDGRGPAVFMTGQFTDMNNVPTYGVARWDGHGWEAVPGGLLMIASPNSHTTVVMNTPRGRALVIAGFSSSDFLQASHSSFAQAVEYIGCPTCYANCDLSTTPPILNVNDFICFMSAFARADPYANCNNDAFRDAADFQCFMTRFAAGCP
jgi:hypothetical protein